MSGDVEYIAQRDADLERWVDAMRKNVAQASQEDLKINDLLEKHRQAHLIPTGAFKAFPCFDWVHLYQLGREDKHNLMEKYGSIYLPETVREAKRDEACRGVLISAGPAALDMLRSNGIDLGHVVRFVKFTPFRLLADSVEGKELWVLAMRAESICDSETLEEMRRDGRAHVVFDLNHNMHLVEAGCLPKSMPPKSAFSDADQDVT